jgi:hypothetical protein
MKNRIAAKATPVEENNATVLQNEGRLVQRPNAAPWLKANVRLKIPGMTSRDSPNANDDIMAVLDHWSRLNTARVKRRGTAISGMVAAENTHRTGKQKIG